jgi:hypothetical protein
LQLNRRESYLPLLVGLGDVDDVAKGGDDVDVDASE